MISIKINDKPILEVCKMKCDDGLSNKLNKYDMTRFLNCHSTNLFLGRPAQGKSSLVNSLFNSKELLKKCFHRIYVFEPANSSNSKVKNLFSQFTELTLENLSYVVNEIKNEDKSINNCIILDNMGAYLKNPETIQLLKELFMNKRHLHVSVFIMQQTWKSCNKEIRKLFNNIFLFKVSRQELEDICEEVIEIDKKILPKYSKLVFDEPYKYMVINIDSQRLFSGFDEIIVCPK